MIGIKTLDTIKTFPRSIHVLVIGEAISALAMGIFNFLQILYYNFIGLSPEAIGLIFSIGSLFGLAGFFVGPFIKIFGRKNLLCLGVGILSIGIVINVFFASFFILLAGQIIISIGTSLIQVTELQLLYSYTTGCKECCAYSYKYSASLIANAVGILVAGNMDRIPYFMHHGYRRLFFCSFIMLFSAGLARYFLLPKDITVDADGGEAKRLLAQSISAIKQDVSIRRFEILLFLATLSFSGVGPYNNLILKIAFNLKNSSISYISFILTILSMIGIVLMPTIIDKLGVEKFNVIIFAGAIGCCALLSIVSNTNVFIGILIIRCIFAFMIASSFESLMMSNIALDKRDVFASVKMLINGVSVALGNFLGGYILNHFGYRANYVYGAVLLIIAVIFFYLRVRKYMANKMVEKAECNCKFKKKTITFK
ncbi:MFS transporter [Clostridium culturomicium]|uniref:MFS transporter n=1 Tax=Clostridium culturomicium TaxID=1499683 RepID=UPI0005911C0E|nr:MFS transporter [Clostridium culturomicium]